MPLTFSTTKRSTNYFTLSSRNRVSTLAFTGAWPGHLSDTGIDSSSAGGYYFEFSLASGAHTTMVGVTRIAAPYSNTYGDATSYLYYSDGTKYVAGANSAYGSTFTGLDVIGCLVKNGKIYFAKNNTWQNSADLTAETGFAASGLTGTYYPCISMYLGSSVTLQGAFSDITYAKPTGSSLLITPERLEMTLPLVSRTGAARASKAVEWAIFTGRSPATLDAPVFYDSATTNGSGELSISIDDPGIADNTAISVLISDTDGTADAQCMSTFCVVSANVVAV